jgi:transporter family protein
MLFNTRWVVGAPALRDESGFGFGAKRAENPKSLSGHWDQKADAAAVGWSMVTGLCVGVGTIFFLLFQKGGPLSAVPMVLAGGAAIMAVTGVLFFKEPLSVTRVAGIVFAIAGLYLMRK